MAASQVAHCPAAHTCVLQSPDVRQALPAPHGGQARPPQSTSVSVPSLTPSEHVEAGEQVREPVVLFVVQLPLAHVAPDVQGDPVRQTAQGPPQSTDVSPPFVAPSSQLGGWQIPPAHVCD